MAKESIGSYDKYRGKYFYCTFCHKTIDNPTIVPLAQGYRYGKFKNIKPQLFLCSTCGGNVIPHKKEQAVGRIRGTVMGRRSNISRELDRHG